MGTTFNIESLTFNIAGLIINIVVLTFNIAVLTFNIAVLTFNIVVLTFNIAVLTFNIVVLTFNIAVITFNIAVITFNNAVITFNNAVITFDIAVITFNNAVITFDIAVITFDIAVITFNNAVITFDIAVLTFNIAGLIFNIEGLPVMGVVLVSNGNFAATVKHGLEPYQRIVFFAVIVHYPEQNGPHYNNNGNAARVDHDMGEQNTNHYRKEYQSPKRPRARENDEQPANYFGNRDKRHQPRYFHQRREIFHHRFGQVVGRGHIVQKFVEPAVDKH